jgi:uncharacterized protein YcfL
MKKLIIILCTLLILVITGCSSNQSITTSANKDNDIGNKPSPANISVPFTLPVSDVFDAAKIYFK